MPLAAELDLPRIDHTDPSLRGARYDAAMGALRGYDGWLAAQPFGYLILDRTSCEFFLRTRSAVFPALTIAELFDISSGPLHEEIVKNIIARNGGDHRRLRNLVNPALAPRRVERYRPAMRAFLAELLSGLPGDGRCEFIEAFAKPYPSMVIAHVMGAPLRDAAQLHHWSNSIQRQFDPASLMIARAEIEQAVAECYAYADALIEQRRATPGEDLITDLISAEEAGDRLDLDELRNLVLNILVGAIDTSQSQLAHAVRLLAGAPEQWELLRSDPHRWAPAAVEEALRFEPITPFTARITTEELEHRGVTFPGRLGRARVRLACQPRSRRARRRAAPGAPRDDRLLRHLHEAQRAQPHVRRRNPQLRRRQPRPRRDPRGPRVSRRARARDQARGCATIRDGVRNLRAGGAAARTRSRLAGPSAFAGRRPGRELKVPEVDAYGSTDLGEHHHHVAAAGAADHRSRRA